MKPTARLIGLVIAGTLVAGGVGVTAALNDLPIDAVPLQDPPAGQPPAQDPAPPVTTPAPQPVPTPSTGRTPEETTAALNSVARNAPVNDLQIARKSDESGQEAEDEEEAEEVEVIQAPTEPEGPPPPRQRRRVAVIQAIDKVTAESIRFEVEVGGRPVAFKRELIFTVRACEVSPSEERDQEAAGYLEISLQPRGVVPGTEPRQIFRGWMFATSPGMGVLEHPVYDAWLVDCTA